jgi:hypothetical protein
MSDRVLSKCLGRKDEDDSEGIAADSGPDGTEDLGAFGWMRGQRDRAMMLELRKKTGEILAIGYGWIERMEFDPSKGITLYCGRQTIHIKGRNLNAEARPRVRLYQGLTRHRVPWMQEADRAADFRADEKAVVIETIEW